jgi:hypothetical protein
MSQERMHEDDVTSRYTDFEHQELKQFGRLSNERAELPHLRGDAAYLEVELSLHQLR